MGSLRRRSRVIKFHHIIAAVDHHDDLIEHVISAANDMALRDGARLEVVSVWPDITATSPAFSAEVAAGAASLSQAALEQHKAGRQNAESDIQKIANKAAPLANVVIIDGDPAVAISDYAEKGNADLIVTGSHQRGFWDRLLQGSASRDLVREAPCAVLVITKSCAKKRQD